MIRSAPDCQWVTMSKPRASGDDPIDLAVCMVGAR